MERAFRNGSTTASCAKALMVRYMLAIAFAQDMNLPMHRIDTYVRHSFQGCKGGWPAYHMDVLTLQATCSECYMPQRGLAWPPVPMHPCHVLSFLIYWYVGNCSNLCRKRMVRDIWN